MDFLFSLFFLFSFDERASFDSFIFLVGSHKPTSLRGAAQSRTHIYVSFTDARLWMVLFRRDYSLVILLWWDVTNSVSPLVCTVHCATPRCNCCLGDATRSQSQTKSAKPKRRSSLWKVMRPNPPAPPSREDFPCHVPVRATLSFSFSCSFLASSTWYPRRKGSFDETRRRRRISSTAGNCRKLRDVEHIHHGIEMGWHLNWWGPSLRQNRS